MTEKKLSLKQHKSISLLIQKGYKEGLNIGYIAAKVGVSDRTLRRWQQDKEYQDEMSRQTKALMNQFLPTVYCELRRIIFSDETADKTKLKAIEMFLRSQGLFKDRAHVIIDTNSGLNSDVSFAAILEELN